MELKKVGVISLGCDKNRVDTEKMLSFLKGKYELTADINEAEIVIINTCAFLESSRKEAIEEILSVAELKKTGKLEKIIVSGCLPQKFIGEIYDALPEADAFMGVSDYKKLTEVIERIYSGERVNAVGIAREEPTTERVLTTNNYAYIKIADGCNNFCTYCLIPFIRGRYRSVPEADIIKEAKSLGNVKELILVAQDTTKYGCDLGGGENIVRLIKKLSALENIGSIRILYSYPENVTDELIEEFVVNDKLVKYIDMPLQHASDSVLKRMNRRGKKAEYLSLIAKMKERIPGIAIRSTFIAGFPGETEEEFDELKEFLSEAKFFNAGFFAYSREEGTAAYNFDNQIDEKEKKKRVKELYKVQKKISKENLKNFKGKTIAVTVDGFDDNSLLWYGRAYFNAPDIDGKVYFTIDRETKSGDKVNVKILKTGDYDLFGTAEQNCRK